MISYYVALFTLAVEQIKSWLQFTAQLIISTQPETTVDPADVESPQEVDKSGLSRSKKKASARWPKLSNLMMVVVMAFGTHCCMGGHNNLVMAAYEPLGQVSAYLDPAFHQASQQGNHVLDQFSKFSSVLTKKNGGKMKKSKFQNWLRTREGNGMPTTESESPASYHPELSSAGQTSNNGRTQPTMKK